MRKWLNNYFDFTKSEFNGLLVLIVLIALVTAAPYAYSLVVKDEYNEEDYLVVQRLILKNEDETVSEKLDNTGYKKKSEYSARKMKASLFSFDPNLIDQDDWIRLGLSERQAAAIIKYVGKGGQFRQVEDLKKMYIITPEKYLEIFPYVKIAKSLKSSVGNANEQKGLIFNQPSVKNADGIKVKSSNLYPSKAAVMVEINGADSASLDDIRGIGPAFALRILNYRERIGGYVSKEQLMEVFGLDSLKYSEIKNQIRVDARSIRRININTVTTDNFQNHPYLRFKQINAIVQYRKQHGNYSNVADLAKVLVIPAETIVRLAPYLTF
ncbi:ComEA family DNA-binding protein [Pedobacter sp. JCM 36344]|uniref:ComEA family DNA-binding protein n=1 Tax=Pedobacter sp. JCM 36344 TaxID=3374280 RepID=UPI003977E925